MKALKYSMLLHDLEKKTSASIDFDADMSTDQLVKNLEIANYKLNQYIQNEYLIELSEQELETKEIPIDKIARTKKSMFGLSQREVNDIFIPGQSEFMYPYTYGHFVYYFSKLIITSAEVGDWINKNASNIFSDLDYIYNSAKEYDIQLINNDDYVIVTSHDFQTQFGIIGSTKQLELIKNKLELLRIKNLQ